MVTRIRKIISFLEEKKEKIEEQIRIKNENLKLLNKEEEKLIIEIKKIQKEFFLKFKREKKAVVNYDFRQNMDFYKSKIMDIRSRIEKIESEIVGLKAEHIKLSQRLKALEKLEERLRKSKRTSVVRKEEKEVSDLMMVKYCGKQNSH